MHLNLAYPNNKYWDLGTIINTGILAPTFGIEAAIATSEDSKSGCCKIKVVDSVLIVVANVDELESTFVTK